MKYVNGWQLVKKTVGLFIVVSAIIGSLFSMLTEQTNVVQAKTSVDDSKLEDTSGIMLFSTPATIDDLTIVANGTTEAVIIVADDADQSIVVATQALAEYMEKSTGVLIPIVTESDLVDDTDQIVIYIDAGHALMDTTISMQLATMDKDGFIIHPTADNQIFIVGPTVWGAINGVYDFLERFVGVRWLLPGPDGEDVPEQDTIVVPIELIKDEPTFTYRSLSPARGNPTDQTHVDYALNEWAERNKLQGSHNEEIKFMHNLYALFPPEKYSDRPEFYVNGKIPKADDRRWGQPCFTTEGTVEAAVSSILAYFDANPSEKYISLGVNDSWRYCERVPEHPHYPGTFNSLGLENMSDIYYGWVNEVIEEVLATEGYEDKWFGLLAYQYVFDPPSFSLHPRAIPFITKDRLAWVDEEVREAEQFQMDEWKEVASQVAWYDYMYGEFYMVPRIYSKQMADNFAYAQDEQVVGHYLEMYHAGGDGPKAWLAAKLMWNADQDISDLSQEWYERTVGTDAAPYLKAHYDLWETFWTEEMTSSNWFEQNKWKTYMLFNDLSYIGDVKKEYIETSKQLLQLAVDHTETAQQLTRAKLLQRAFEFYEASILSYPIEVPLIDNVTEALALVDDIELQLEKRLVLAAKRRQLKEDYEADPILKMRSFREDWTGLNTSEFWRLIDYMRTYEASGGAVVDRMNDLSQSGDTDLLRQYAQLVLEAYDGLFSLTQNSSFEDGDEVVSIWKQWGGKNVRVEGISHTGNASLLRDQMGRGGPTQTFEVKEGLLAAQVYYYTPSGTKRGTIQLVIRAKNNIGANMVIYESEVAPLSATVGEWASLELLEQIPAEFAGEEITQAQVLIIIDGAETSQVYIDDFVVFQVNEEVINQHNFWERLNVVEQSIAESNSLLQKLQRIAEYDEPSDERIYARLLLKMVEGELSLTANSSFEDGVDRVDVWKQWGGPNIRVEAEETARTGNASLLRDRQGRGGPTQRFAVQEGPLAVRVHYYSPLGTDRGTLEVMIRLENDAGNMLAEISTSKASFSTTAGSWSARELLIDVPEKINGEMVKRAQVLAVFNNAETSQVYLDDFIAYQ